MEQSISTVTPVADSGKQNSGKGSKIAAVIASVVAICGIAFGVYGMMQNSQKDSQISDLKVQIEDKEGAIATLETEKTETTDENGSLTIVGTIKNINENESVKLYCYASTTLSGNRYSLILQFNNDATSGFFTLIESSAMFSDIASGYANIENNNITFSVGPFVDSNDFTSELAISRDMGFSFDENVDEQENYRGYITTYDREKITLGDVVLEKIN